MFDLQPKQHAVSWPGHLFGKQLHQRCAPSGVIEHAQNDSAGDDLPLAVQCTPAGSFRALHAKHCGVLLASQLRQLVGGDRFADRQRNEPLGCIVRPVFILRALNQLPYIFLDSIADGVIGEVRESDILKFDHMRTIDLSNAIYASYHLRYDDVE